MILYFSAGFDGSVPASLIMEVTEENKELQKQRYVWLYLQFVNKYPYQFVSHKKFLKYIYMYDTKIDIHVPVRNYYSDAVRGVKCIKEMEKILSLDTFIL